MEVMQKLGSILIVLLFITAYGRCVADGLGALQASEASCCPEVSMTVEVSDSHDHDVSSESEHPGEKDSPAPCQLCFILSNDSLIVNGGDIELPSPTFQDVLDLAIAGIILDHLTEVRLDLLSADLTVSDFPNLSDEQRSLLQRIAVKTTPVRGPSIA